MKGLDTLFRTVLSRYAQGDFEPPVALIDRPNVVSYPVLQREPLDMSRVQSPLGEFAMQLGDQAMSQFGPGAGMGADPMAALAGVMGGGGGGMMPGMMPGGPMPGGQVMGGDPMMGGVDAMSMLMGGGMGAGPRPAPLPEEAEPPGPGVM